MSVDLARAVAMALEGNPDVRAGEEDVAVLDAQRDRAAGERWPALRAVGSLTEYRRLQRLYPAAIPGEPAALSHQIAGADAVVTWPLFTAGRLGASVAAAERLRAAASHGLTRTRAEVIFSVTSLYHALLAQRQLALAIASSEEGLVEQVRRIEAMVRERKAAPLDRQRLEVRLAAVRQRRIQEDNLRALQEETFTALLGIDGARTALVVEGDLQVPQVVADRDLERSVARALAQRPDYLGALSGLSALDARRDVARAGHWPQLSIQGSYGARWSVAPSVEPAGVDSVADVGQVALLLDVPLFLGGRVDADVREQEARMSAARERLRRLELRIRVEVAAAVGDIRSASARADLAETARSQAAEAYRVEREKYAAGKSTISDVLGAQADLLDAEANLARALADANIAVAELALAKGDTQ